MKIICSSKYMFETGINFTLSIAKNISYNVKSFFWLAIFCEGT